MVNFEYLLKELDKLNLPKDEYIIFGSGPIAIRKIREADDIDIVVTPALWKKLVKIYEPNAQNGRIIKLGRIEIGKDYKPWFDNTSELFKKSDLIKGHRFVNLKLVIIWKEKFGREKDKKDIELIKKYMNR